MQEPKVSIVVPTWRRPDGLKACIESIRRTVIVPHEVIVVAVADDQPTLDILRDLNLSPILQPQRGGFVKAANLGFKSAKGEYLIQISDDTTLLPHSIENAIRFLEAPAHAEVGIAAFFHNSRLSRNIYQQVQLDGEWFYVAHVRGLCYANYGLARRNLYESLGWFDERFTLYGADPDFSLKVWHHARLTVTPCPGALIRHHDHVDSRRHDDQQRLAADNQLLFDKWTLDSSR